MVPKLSPFLSYFSGLYYSFCPVDMSMQSSTLPFSRKQMQPSSISPSKQIISSGVHRNSKRHDCSLSRYFYLIQLLFTFNQWYSTSKDFRREIVPENRRIFQNNVICFNNQRLFEGITQLVDDDIFLFAVFIGFFCPVVMQVLSDFILQLI